MLQILSTSNETSTGTELVQNGNFSELGSDLVTNGDFSAAESNLVSNPNFTGVTELVDNNDFSNGTTDWSAEGSSTISVGTHEGRSNVANVNILNTSTASRIEQPFTYVDGASYKVTVEVYVVSGSFRIDCRDTFVTTDFVSTTTTGEWQTLTAYITAIQSDTDVIWLRSNSPGGISQFYVDSVSIKELGEDWVSVDDTNTFDANGLTMTSTEGTDVKVYQANVITSSKSYKVTYTIHENGLTGTNAIQYYTGSALNAYDDLPEQGVGTHTFYYTTPASTNQNWFFRLDLRNASTSTTDFVTISSISVQELGEGWTVGDKWSLSDEGARLVSSTSTASGLSQSNVFEIGKSYKVTLDAVVNSGIAKLEKEAGAVQFLIDTTKTYVEYFEATKTSFYLNRYTSVSDIYINNITVQELDPNGYWTLGTGWSIGADKAISTVTGSNSDITQSILTAGKTYRTVYEIVDYAAGTAQAIVTGSDGADAVALGTYTEDLTTTGTDFSIRSKLGTFDGAVSSVSVKQLGTYEDQSIYVTAADVQTIPQASVYYLVELTSMGSKNSLYFIPSSVIPNNGRYTKLNFTVISKDALPQPTVGIISFYDSVGGLDTYPMGFYEFRIYEQTSSTNLDPLLATGLLEKGFAFVRDFSGNMQELTDGFKEYNPALTQYVYSK